LAQGVKYTVPGRGDSGLGADCAENPGKRRADWLFPLLPRFAFGMWLGFVLYKEIIWKRRPEYMDLKLDEQRLLTEFRRLHGEGKAELLDYAVFLVKKYANLSSEELSSSDNQCPIRKQEEERPEAVKEPIFTE
jgi:hypothetical protein